MVNNPVLSSTKFLIENPTYVTINQDKLEEYAERLSEKELFLPDWTYPEYIEGNFEEVVDFFCVFNTLNFAFTDFENGEKYTTTHWGKEFKGSSGMIAALKNAYQEGVPILEGSYLRDIPEQQVKEIFRGNIEIPMLKERFEILREVGDVLTEHYMGRFHNLFFDSRGRLFNEGQGFVDRLVNSFPSFNDSTQHNGKEVKFYKRAMLAGGMLYGRFQNGAKENDPIFTDMDNCANPADYVLPKSFRDLGIFEYEETLAERVDNGILIPQNSLEELELRASTVHACKELVDLLNNKYEKGINTFHVDAELWNAGRKTPGRHHLTKTIAY